MAQSTARRVSGFPAPSGGRWLRALLVLFSLAAWGPLPPLDCAAGTTDKSLNIGLDSAPANLDYMSTFSGNMLQYAHWVFEPLARWNTDMELVPRLAQKWEMQGRDCLQVKLREGVLFHSGNRLTSADVAWTLARARRHASWAELFGSIDRVETPDPLTIRIHFTRPDPLAATLLTSIYPMDSRWCEANADALATSPQAVSGAGPFRVAEFTAGSRLVLTRFDKYWDKKCVGNVAAVTVTAIPNSGARVEALVQGGQDCISPVPPGEVERLRRMESMKLLYMASNRVLLVAINTLRRPELRDRRVRRALVAAVNNAGIVDKVMRKLTTPANQLSARGMSGFSPDMPPRFDMIKARQLLAEAGLADGLRLTMIAPNNRYANDDVIAEAVAAMLERVGIRVDLHTMPVPAYWDAFKKREADLQMIGWHPDTEDTANTFQFLTSCPGGALSDFNTGYCNPALDALVQQAGNQHDPQERDRLLREAERIVSDDAAFITLHYEPLIWACNSRMRMGKAVNRQNILLLQNVVVE